MAGTAEPQPTRVEGHPAPDNTELLDTIAWLMDDLFKVPGTKFRVGLDSIVGLLPVGGDVAGGLVQALLIGLAMYHYKVPKHVAARMAINSLLDTTIGVVPVLGDAFDFVFKANSRNLELLKRAASRRR